MFNRCISDRDYGYGNDNRFADNDNEPVCRGPGNELVSNTVTLPVIQPGKGAMHAPKVTTVEGSVSFHLLPVTI